MLIECPKCSARYNVAATSPIDGRKVRCARCGNVWRASGMNEVRADGPAPEAAKPATGQAQPTTHSGAAAAGPQAGIGESGAYGARAATEGGERSAVAARTASAGRPPEVSRPPASAVPTPAMADPSAAAGTAHAPAAARPKSIVATLADSVQRDVGANGGYGPGRLSDRLKARGLAVDDRAAAGPGASGVGRGQQPGPKTTDAGLIVHMPGEGATAILGDVPKPAPRPAPSEARPPAPGPLAEGDTPAVPASARPHQAAGQSGPAYGLIAGWAVLGVIVAAIVGIAVFASEMVVRTFPGSAKLYAAAGINVNARGLRLEGVTSQWSRVNERAVVRVQGKVRNVSTRQRAVPPLVLLFEDAKGRVLFPWAIKPPAGQLASGAEIAFSAEVPAPKTVVYQVRVRFALADR